MSLSLLHIAEGWAKTIGLMKISTEAKLLSEERLKICAECPVAKESKALEILKGSIEKVDIIYCTVCHCPCHEKSMVAEETCPQNKW